MQLKSLHKYLLILLVATTLIVHPAYADHLQQAESIAKAIPFLQRQTLSVTTLSGGLTNHIYLIKTSTGEAFVLRVFGSEAQSLGIDPAVQASIATSLGKLAVGPKVVYLSADQKCTLFEYVIGRPLRRPDFDAKVRADLMQKLRRLHEHGNFANQFDPFITASAFRQTALYKSASVVASFPVADMQIAASRMRSIQDSLSAHSKQFIRSGHNDLHCDNILFDPDLGSLSIIDLDYAGKSDLFFDLAILANSLKLDAEESAQLLASYFAPRLPNQRDLAHFEIMRLVSIYWNSMWYFSQVGSSSIEHDHLHSGKDDLRVFLQQTTTDEFKEHLNTLTKYKLRY